MRFESYGPNDDDDNGNGDFRQRSNGMGAAVVEQHVMEVRLVSLEG